MGLEEVEVEERKNLEGEGVLGSGPKMKPVSRLIHVPLKSSTSAQWRWVLN